MDQQPSDRIRDAQAYRNKFKDEASMKEAIKIAVDTRKFEIELYWKRATYFWTFIAATFTGYFLIAGRDPATPLLRFLLCSMGVVLAWTWYLVNRGSKYWQANWENHVDLLEDVLFGPLFKTVIAREQFRIRDPFSPFPFSVSKLNQILSLFVLVVWVLLFLTELLVAIFGPLAYHGPAYFGITILTALFLWLLTSKGRTSYEEISCDFEIRRLRSDHSSAQPSSPERTPDTE